MASDLDKIRKAVAPCLDCGALDLLCDICYACSACHSKDDDFEKGILGVRIRLTPAQLEAINDGLGLTEE